MAIVRMISRDPEEFRAFQVRMTTVGKIRLGKYNGRFPEKLDTFRFTADNEALIRAIAEEYGGTAEQWRPQGGGQPQWQVVSNANAVEVYVVNGQAIDPSYEAWAGGRTCVRRCDGVLEQIKQEPCLCNGPNRPAPRDLCKPTVRVQVMLKRIQGLGSWLLESHGENACMELAMFGPFVASAPMPVPAMLRLRHETRRQWNADKGKFDTLDFYVPWFDISAVTAQQVAIGGDALTQALTAAGAPAAIGGGDQRQAIEAAPVSAVPATAPTVRADARGGYVGPGPDIEVLRPTILADIEKQTTLDGIDAIKEKLKARGINDAQVKGAWASKRAAIKALALLEATAPADLADAVDALAPEDREALRERLTTPPDPEREYRIGDTVTVGGIEFTKIGDDPFNHPFADVRKEYDEAIARGATMQAIIDAGGPIHWLAGDDQAQDRAHDTLAEVHEGVVEPGPADDLPMVPDGDYDRTDQLMFLMREAGKKSPPLTTDQATALVVGAFALPHIGAATGQQVARVVEALKRGLLP